MSIWMCGRDCKTRLDFKLKQNGDIVTAKILKN